MRNNMCTCKPSLEILSNFVLNRVIKHVSLSSRYQTDLLPKPTPEMTETKHNFPKLTKVFQALLINVTEFLHLLQGRMWITEKMHCSLFSLKILRIKRYLQYLSLYTFLTELIWLLCCPVCRKMRKSSWFLRICRWIQKAIFQWNFISGSL